MGRQRCALGIWSAPATRPEAITFGLLGCLVLQAIGLTKRDVLVFVLIR